MSYNTYIILSIILPLIPFILLRREAMRAIKKIVKDFK